MKYSHPGRTKLSKSQQGLASLVYAGVIPPPKQRKARKKETKPRNRQEDIDRPIIMERLRKDGWECWRVEPCGKYGKKGFGLGDLWLYHKGMKQIGWGECKSSVGGLSIKQKERRDECRRCGVYYWVVRLFGQGYTMELYGD